MRDTKGKRLADGADQGVGLAGFEYTAKTTGTYYLVALRCDKSGASSPVATYDIAVASDCAASTKTDCVLKVPGNSGQRLIFYTGDVDYWRVNLSVGQSYSFRAVADGDPRNYIELVLLDTTNNSLLEEDDTRAINHFVPKKTGAYYLIVANSNDDISAYVLTASKP